MTRMTRMTRRTLAWGILGCFLLAVGSPGARGIDPRPLSVIAGGSRNPAAAAGDDRPALTPAVIEFVRVNAAATAIDDVPIDAGRSIPMPLAEFNAAVATIGAGPGSRFQPTATTASYDLATAADGGLVGEVSFEVGDLQGAVRTAMPLGAVAAERCLVRSAAGTGEAAVFGLPDGRVAVQIVGPGTYRCGIRLPPLQAGRLTRLPLVSALVTTITLRLPAGERPVVFGAAATSALIEPPAPGGTGWRIVTAAATELPLTIQESRRTAPAVTCWNHISLRGRQADVATRIVPLTGWTAADLDLTADPALVTTGVRDDSGRDVPWTGELGELRISIPERLIGSQTPLVVTGIVPVAESGSQPVPDWRPHRSRWAGAGSRVVTDGAFAVEAIELDQCLALTPADAAAWPLPTSAEAGRPLDTPPAGCRLFLEHQSPAAIARIAVGPRAPAFDTARITTVDVSPGTVLGRAACDVRVVAGEVFSLAATVAPGWFIDSVEAVDWQRPPRQRQGQESVDSALDWRVVRSPAGNELRIGLASAASSARRLGLLITGHRPGVPLGSRFSLAELDMVRLPGESPELSLLEFRVGPMAVVETEGETLPIEPATGRLAPLATESPPRARVRAGDQAAPLLARLVRRRPPVDAEVRVGLMARDERVAETFGFTCHPVAGEIDAVVVHFSEPMPNGLEWTLLEPATGSLAARRLDPGEAAMGAAMPDLGVAESWLVDVRPATAGTVRFTAARIVAMEAAVPVPLAWVEGAEQPGGRVTIAGEAGQRPELLNRRLREVPPTDHDGAAVVRLAYGSPESVTAAGGPAAELMPPAAAAGARAWAWRESIICECHDSGMLEWESRLDIENQGRASVSLTVPDGLRLESVSVAGGGIAAGEFGQSGGTLVVPLPTERGRVSLVISGTGARDSRFGWWSPGAIACGIDLPILTRDARLLLPPGLALISGHGAPRDSWAMRLFQATVHDGSPQAVTRSFDVTSSTRAGVTGAIVMRRWLITSAALLAGGLAILASWKLVGFRPVVAIVSCGAAGLLALWLATPWDAIARTVWWGSLVGIWFAAWQGRFRGRVASGLVPRALLLIGVGCLGGNAFGEEASPPENRPLRVIVSEQPGGGIALVPEALFRRLAVAEAATAVPAVRVVQAEVCIEPDRDVWRLRLALDADRGGTLRLPSDSGGHWMTDIGQTTEGSLAVEIGADQIQLFSPEGGRAEITLRYQPAFVPDGAVETAVMRLPPAAAAKVVVPARAAGEKEQGWQCDRFEAEGPWLPAAWTGNEFDVSRAARIRIVRPALSTDLLVAQPRAADSVNDVSWRSTECRVDASFTIGGAGEIVRRLVLRADAGLQPVVGANGFESLGDGRYQVDFVEPAPGPRTVTASFRMPLTDPVGVFDLPGVWLEGVGTDQRTVRLRPEPGLDAAAELPRGLTLLRPRAEDGPTTAALWRTEAVAEAADAGGEAAARPRIAVRRRPVPPRGSQSLLVTVAADRISLQLDVELEAVTLPLVQIPAEIPADATIDQLVVTRRSEGGEALEPIEIDTVWSRSAAGRLAVVVQRPDTGLFHLRLAARVPGPPPGRGRMPLVRADLNGSLPLAVRWQALGGLIIDLSDQAAVGEPRKEWIEIPVGEPGPAYELVRAAGEHSAEAPVAADLPAVAVDVGVALTDVHLAIDHRGRGWGLARFDLVAADPTLLLELPAGLRLFDVRVDGREVTAAPRGNSTWEVRLHDVTWPRTLVALFAGSVSGPLADGKPIRLVPPRVVGLPAADVIWSLDVPAGYALRSGESATPLDAGIWRAGTERSGQWYGEAFQAAIAAVGPEEREWLEAFAAARRAGTAPAGEEVWYAAWSSAAAESTGRTRLDAGSEGAVTVRPVAVRDATTAARGLASLGLVAAVGAIVAAGRRMPAAGWQAVARWWWVGCGLAWMALLQPTLPGWLMLGFGLWVAFGARGRFEPDTAD